MMSQDPSDDSFAKPNSAPAFPDSASKEKSPPIAMLGANMDISPSEATQVQHWSGNKEATSAPIAQPKAQAQASMMIHKGGLQVVIGLGQSGLSAAKYLSE